MRLELQVSSHDNHADVDRVAGASAVQVQRQESVQASFVRLSWCC